MTKSFQFIILNSLRKKNFIIILFLVCVIVGFQSKVFGFEKINLSQENFYFGKTAEILNGEKSIKSNQSQYSCENVIGVSQSDCEALVVIHEKMYSYTYGEEWLSNNAPCTWEGVTCKEGRVTELALQPNKPNATIPTEIGNLTELIHLRIGVFDELTGTIPDSIGNLTNLVSLSITGFRYNPSKLSGTIPNSIGNLIKLENLELQYNNLIGSIPATVGNLTQLSRLDIGHNPLSGSIPLELMSTSLGYYNDMHTNLCAPNDPTFLTWFENIWSEREAQICGDYSISGRITDSGNNPLSNTLIKTDNGLMVISDTSGDYQINNLVNDTYNLYAELNNYSFVPFSQDVNINDEDVVNIDFTGIRVTSSVKTIQNNINYLFNNKVFEISPSELNIQFSADLLNDNSLHSATYFGNWMLISTGKNEIIDTPLTSPSICNLPHIPEKDDELINISEISYMNNVVKIMIDQNDLPLSSGSYKLFGCAEASIWDTNMSAINNGQNFGINFSIKNFAISPNTGFSHNELSLIKQPRSNVFYSYNEMTLRIPFIEVSAKIVGVPFVDGEWDTYWLGNDIGYLSGSAYPLSNGNTVLSAHVWNIDNTPGVFYDIKKLRYDDLIEISSNGQVYQYAVRENFIINDNDFENIFKSESFNWLSLITCEDYDSLTDSYLSRRIIRAVLINIK